MSQGDQRSAKVWRRGMKSNDERIKTLEKFNIIGRKKRPVAAVLLLLLTAVFIVLGIVVPSFAIVVVIVPITSAIFFYLAAAVFLSLSIAYVQGCGRGALPVLRRGILSHAGQEPSALQKMRQGQLQGIKQNKNQPPQGFFPCGGLLYNNIF